MAFGADNNKSRSPTEHRAKLNGNRRYSKSFAGTKDAAVDIETSEDQGYRRSTKDQKTPTGDVGIIWSIQKAPPSIQTITYEKAIYKMEQGQRKTLSGCTRSP